MHRSRRCDAAGRCFYCMKNLNKIKILPPEISNKIAAGEVVERPASVVKELVENALDADAGEITIVLKNGGKELIRIIDDGKGMDGEDLKLAFERHATSKIVVAEDLACIRTLGFRGEALASIASVSRVEAKSIAQGKISGMQITLEDGRVTEEKPAGGTAGTAIAVKNLFYNTPARRKFLRADSTEYRRCLVTANRFALAFPDKTFTLVHNGEVIWEVKPAPLLDRICGILGNRIRPMLVEVQDDSSPVKIQGYVGNHDTIRRQSGEQYLLLNGRYFQNRSLNHAIISAYGEILAHGGYPLYVLNLGIDPTRVDVNVHPTKMEVKFADDRLVYSLLRSAVRQALISAKVVPDLQQQGSSIPQQSTRQWIRSEWQQNFSGGGQPLSPGQNTTPNAEIPSHEIYAPPGQPPQEGQLGFDMSPKQQPGGETEAGAAAAPAQRVFSEQPPVWQVHNRYILTQTKSGLVIIDQHVAHERILYEKALKDFENKQPASQRVLFPIMVDLSAEDREILNDMRPFLERLGFQISEFGGNTVVIDGVPAGLRIKNYATILQEMIDDYKRGKRGDLEIRDNVAKTFACHSAIRSGDSLTIAEMQTLLQDLFETETPYFCPHGRPVIVNVSLDELDKRFGRI